MSGMRLRLATIDTALLPQKKAEAILAKPCRSVVMRLEMDCMGPRQQV